MLFSRRSSRSWSASRPFPLVCLCIKALRGQGELWSQPVTCSREQVRARVRSRIPRLRSGLKQQHAGDGSRLVGSETSVGKSCRIFRKGKRWRALLGVRLRARLCMGLGVGRMCAFACVDNAYVWRDQEAFHCWGRC